MMRFALSEKLIFLCLALLPWSVNAVEIMKWERLPLAIPLAVHQERVIFLDKNVRVGMDASLQGKLRVQSASGTLYLHAQDEIAPSRLQVQVVETGEIILLDVATVSGKQSVSMEPIRIIDENSAKIVASEEEQGQQEKKEAVSLQVPAPVALTRYAAQSLYAPLRTVEPVPGIRQVSARVDKVTNLFPTERLSTHVLVRYRLGEFYVTAIKLINRSPTRIDLDPRKLQGQFYAATFQHPFLGAMGTVEDTTVVYLVTKGAGLDKALIPLPSPPATPASQTKTSGEPR